MVGVDKDDGVVGDAFSDQLIEARLNVVVEVLDLVVVLRPLPTDFRVIGMVGRERKEVGIVGEGRSVVVERALVGAEVIEDGHERSAGIGSILPVGITAGGVPSFSAEGTTDIVVLLGSVGGVVAQVLHHLGIELEEGRRGSSATMAVIGRTGGRPIHSRNEGGTGGRADGRVGPGAEVA